MNAVAHYNAMAAHAMQLPTSCKTIVITDQKAVISINGDLDVTLKQVSPIFADCWMSGKFVIKVKASDGIEFAANGICLSLPRNHNITDLCDLPALAKQITDEQDERDDMQIHLHAEELAEV